MKGKLTAAIFRHRAFLCIVLISLLVKIFLLIQSPVVNRDAVVYISAAQQYAAGLYAEGSQHYGMPLYPLLLAAIRFLIPDWILAGQLLSLFPLVICLLPVYLLTMRLFDRVSALAASLLFAVLPVFNQPVTAIIRDPLFLLLVLSALALFAWRQSVHPFVWMTCLLLLLVLAPLIRIEGVLLIGLMPVLALFASERKHKGWTVLAFWLTAVGLTATGILSILWYFSQSGFSTLSRFPELVQWGRDFITLDLFNQYQQIQEQLKDIQKDFPQSDLKNNLIETVRHYTPLIYLLGLLEILVKEVFPTSLVALWALRHRRSVFLERSCAVIVWPWVVFFLLNVLFSLIYNFSVTRYLWIPIALTLPFVGYGAGLWWQRLTGRSLLVGLMAILLFVVPAAKTLSYMEKEKSGIVMAGNWLAGKDVKNELRVLVNDRRLCLYADRVAMDNCQYADDVAEQLQAVPSGEEYDLLILIEKSGSPQNHGGYRLLGDFSERRSVTRIYQRPE